MVSFFTTRYCVDNNSDDILLKVLGMPLSDARPNVLGLDPAVLSYTVESGKNPSIFADYVNKY